MLVVEKTRAQKSNLKFCIIVAGLVIFGVLLGAGGLYALSYEKLNDFSFVQSYIVTERKSMDVIRILLNSFVTGTLFLIIPFLLGFSAISRPLLFAVPVFRGLGLGIGIASLYYSMGYKGVAVAALTIVPPAVITVYALVIGIRESFFISGNLASVMFSKRNFMGLGEAAKLYCVKYLVLEAIVAIGSAVDALCSFIMFRII